MKRIGSSFLVVVSVTATMFLSEAARACGRLSLIVTNVATHWDRNVELHAQDVLISRSNASQSCNFFVTFSEGQAHSFQQRSMRNGGAALGYQLFGSPFRNEGQVLKGYPGTITTANVLSGSFGRGQSQVRLTYYFGLAVRVDPSEVPKGGFYHDSFIVSVYQGNLGSTLVPDDSTNVFVNLFVPRMLQLSLVPTGAQFRFGQQTQSMDFGVLRQGDSKDFDLRINTNARYSVSLSSQNNGALRLQGKTARSAVDYEIAVDSEVKNLADSHDRPVLVARGGSGSQADKTRHNVRITIGDVHGKLAGQYADVITIYATPIE